MSTLEALRAKANIEGRQAFLTQFRADFKAMFAHWRQTGQISEVEAMQQADAGASKAPEVDTGAASADTSTTRKRARFQSPGSTIQSVSI